MTKIKKMIRKLDYKTLNLLPKIKKVLIKLYNVPFFLKKAEKHISNKESYKARKVIDRGLRLYPHNFNLNRLKAIMEMENEDYNLSYKHWKKLIKNYSENLSVKDYLKAFDTLIILKNEKVAIKVLEKGLINYPRDVHLIKKLSDHYRYMKKWNQIIIMLKELIFSNNYDPDEDDFINLAHAYNKLNMLEHAEHILQISIERFKDSPQILMEYIKHTILAKKWNLGAKLITHLFDNFSLDFSQEQFLKYGMIYQLANEKEKYTNIYENILNDYNTSSEDVDFNYTKINLFNNGETIIDFYKRNTSTNKVIITFDSINMTWKDLPFGYKLLSKQNIDIIAVQKRKPQTYQQDLTLEEFTRVVEPLVNTYKYCISYGFSLGAYMALYYTGSMNCQILALSPRLSIHPIYGRAAVKGKIPFYHQLKLKSNKNIQPIIVYDSKNRIDKTYVNDEIVLAFPKAKLIKTPYLGHRIAPNLLNMGLLKEFVLKVVVENRIPTYDKKARFNIGNYYRHLGNECYRRGKYEWAFELVSRAYALMPKEIGVAKLKAKLLILKDMNDEAEKVLHAIIASKPKNLSLRITLIDYYISVKNVIKAEEELEKTEKLFGDSKHIKIKREQIKETYSRITNGILK